MQSTNEIVEEAKKKRMLSNLKATSLPENQNTNQPEKQNYGNQTLIEEQKHSNTTKQEKNNSVKTVLPENQNTIKKVKVTVYITEEAWEDFNTIYGKRILDKRKTDKGDLMTEAIELLKQKENTRTP